MYSSKTEYSEHGLPAAKPDARIEQRAAEAKKKRQIPQPVSASEWLRQVLGIDVPFGQDGLPTVWG
ncbi:MAG TPA: hypothetical protein VNA16_10020 [Abditibacteriaceae bacterium]|nr:hypothetical protein [Abditibacteriaceae bacterium]